MDLSSLKRVYEPAQTWLDTQRPLQAKLSESDDPAMPVAEIDSRVRDLERVLNRIYAKMGAAAGSESEKGRSNSKSSSSKKSKGKGKKTSSTTTTTSSTSSTSTTSMKDEL